MAIPFPYTLGGHQIQKGSVTLRDDKGWTSTMRYFLNPNGDTLANGEVLATAIQTTWAAMSNAALQSTQGLNSQIGVVQRGVSGEYQTIIAKAVLTFQDNSGQLHRFQLPSPKIAIFLADGVTVDPTNTDVQAFVTAMGATGSPPAATTFFASTRQGNYFANFVGGTWRAAKPRKRFNVLVLTPDLTGQEPGE